MRREEERKQWEKDVMTEIHQGPLHYENLKQGGMRPCAIQKVFLIIQ